MKRVDAASEVISVELADIQAARERISGQVAYTPVEHSTTLSGMTGANVHLKFENLQFTSSFKERGALNCLLCLSEGERAQGVVAMSAGNHAQALACHGKRLGIRRLSSCRGSRPTPRLRRPGCSRRKPYCTATTSKRHGGTPWILPRRAD